MKKEIAKFLCGLTAWESFTHLSLKLNGLVPLKLFGFTISESTNTIEIITFALISFLLGYYAWKK